MNPLSFSPGIRDARAAAIRDALDADASPGCFAFFTGPRPPTGAATTTQVRLGTCVLSHPCGSVAGAALVFGAIADDGAADATGTAVWLRGFDGAGNFCLDMDVSGTDGDAPCKLTSPGIVAGGRIAVASATITEGNA